MTRSALPLMVDDLSAFSRALARQLAANPAPPGHLALMNMLARAGGYRNFQHLRASASAEIRLASPPDPQPDMARVEMVLRQFDAEGRLRQWPARTVHQHLAVRALWARLPRAEVMTERQVSARLNHWHAFGDAAILRRTMVELGLLSRTQDGSEYRRIEAPPTPEARALIRLLQARTAPAPTGGG